MQTEKDVVIALMGPTGAGKTSFINTISGSGLTVGHGLKSETAKVAASQPFEFCERRIVLIDTPGFDDTLLSDTDVLKMIALFLSTTYEQNFKLSGIIYLHPISDFRFGGVARKNFGMFRQLCGEKSLRNVVIATSKWGEVTEQRGTERERELAEDPVMFKHAIDAGATLIPYHGDRFSGQSLLMHLINNNRTVLQIQEELVDKHMDITRTAAGRELQREFAMLKERYQEDLASLRRDIHDAMKAKNEEAQNELEEAKSALEQKVVKAAQDHARLSEEYLKEKREADAKIQELLEKLREQQNRGPNSPLAEQQVLGMLEEVVRQREELAREKAQWEADKQRDEEEDGPNYISIAGQVIAVVLQVVLAATGVLGLA